MTKKLWRFSYVFYAVRGALYIMSQICYIFDKIITINENISIILKITTIIKNKKKKYETKVVLIFREAFLQVCIFRMP